MTWHLPTTSGWDQAAAACCCCSCALQSISLPWGVSKRGHAAALPLSLGFLVPCCRRWRGWREGSGQDGDVQGALQTHTAHMHTACCTHTAHMHTPNVHWTCAHCTLWQSTWARQRRRRWVAHHDQGTLLSRVLGWAWSLHRARHLWHFKGST